LSLDVYCGQVDSVSEIQLLKNYRCILY